jgi:ankyrin repeat protein
VGVSERPDVIELLVARGADLDARDSAGATPLQWAATYGTPATVELLQRLGARE